MWKKTNIISGKNPTHLSKYTTNFYTLLHNYYTINKLSINSDKTKLLVSSKSKLTNITKKLSFMAINHKISQSHTIKILGAYIQSNLSLDTHINKIISKLNFKLHTLRQINKFTTFNTRKIINNALIMGTLKYILPLHININQQQLNKIHKLIMATARQTIGTYGFKISCAKILNKCEWMDVSHMIIVSSLKFIHNIFVTRQPTCLLNLYNMKLEQRSSNRKVTKYYPKIKSNIQLVQNSLMYKATEIYNKVPDYLLTLNITKFNKEINQYVAKNFPANSNLK